METVYTKEELMKAKQALTHLRNLSIIMKLLFKSPSEVMQEHNCTLDEACEKLEKAYNYVHKYGEFHIQNILTDVKPIIDQLLYDSIKKPEESDPTDNVSRQ